MSTLYHAKDNQEYAVTSIPEVHLLEVLGVFVGSKVMKKATYSGGGPALVTVEGREVAIGKDYAMAIEVEEQGVDA